LIPPRHHQVPQEINQEENQSEWSTDEHNQLCNHPDCV
jgi:hypothetical protein